jgi:ABC-2 type transport system ATP-binding protein
MVTFSNVTKKFGAVRAVDNVSLTVQDGEFFALLGPNGAGKTTLVRMLLGFSVPTSGGITIDGVSSREPASRRRVGYLPETLAVPRHLSARQYLSRQAELCGMPAAEGKKRINELLDVVGMAADGRRPAGACSKGMLQRIGLAAAMLAGTRLLVLDEPVGGLDPIGIRDVRRIMDGFKQKGVTIILNSHLLSEVEKTCTTAAIIRQGRVLVKDELSNIVRGDETLEDVFVRTVEAGHA